MDKRKNSVYKLDKKKNKVSYRFGDDLIRFRDELFNMVRERLGHNVTDSAIARATYLIHKEDPELQKVFIEKVTDYLKRTL